MGTLPPTYKVRSAKFEDLWYNVRHVTECNCLKQVQYLGYRILTLCILGSMSSMPGMLGELYMRVPRFDKGWDSVQAHPRPCHVPRHCAETRGRNKIMQLILFNAIQGIDQPLPVIANQLSPPPPSDPIDVEMEPSEPSSTACKNRLESWAKVSPHREH